MNFLKRRSKSLDDINKPTFYHQNACTLTSPVINTSTAADIPKRRRHSLYIESSHPEYSRLATIYGWITKDIVNDMKRTTTTRSPPIRDSSNISPKEPIENDPHVFDLLLKDSMHFINYGKSDSVTSATIEKLVEKLTREMDHDFLMDFFLIFRQFVTPIKLCKLLISRFRWTLLEETDERRLIRIRTFVVIRHWLTHYWTYDFMNSRTLRFMLCTFLTQLRTHPLVLSSPRNERIVKSLRRVLKRQRRFYQTSQSRDSVLEFTHSIWANKLKDTFRESNIKKDRFWFHIDLKQHKFLSFIHSNQSQSLILHYRSEVITQQFCLIERDMLQTVSWEELVELRWRKNEKRNSEVSFSHSIYQSDLKGVELLIDFFNKTCQWVACEVVKSRLLETRVRVVEKFIRIAFKCYQHRNYSTLMQILLGLQLPAVTRLEKTWERVDHHQRDLFDQLKELTKPFRNWKNVRECMTEARDQVSESFAVECVLTHSLKDFDHVNGCIPFLGLFLSDLVFLAELPTFINATADISDDDEEEKDRELCERLCNNLVNYNKFRIIASVIKHVLTFQVLSRAYKFKPHPHLFTQLQRMSLLDNSQIREASFLCEE